ncbi:MAG TPA: 30S ribosomal protein S12 methylthiotransferase RimO, partial [Streptosporangiaceae bacterium]|nr:30S ribosomal protein S12 methylthiotransferase RimO [Streptosporangiaceae bacterium]
PQAGARSNVIVGFPGETRADVAELERFLTEARLDAIGVFDYSDEEGTEAAGFSGKVSPATVKRRYGRISALAEELCNQRAEDRLGTEVDVLVESLAADELAEGRAAHQAPEVDGSTRLTAELSVRVGDLVRARVIATEGVDLVAVPLKILDSSSGPS